MNENEDESVQLRTATNEAIIETAQARAILHRATQDMGSTPEQVARAAMKYRKLEKSAHDAVAHEIDYHYVDALHSLRDAHPA